VVDLAIQEGGAEPGGARGRAAGEHAPAAAPGGLRGEPGQPRRLPPGKGESYKRVTLWKFLRKCFFVK
jgi:hypothetical protein